MKVLHARTFEHGSTWALRDISFQYDFDLNATFVTPDYTFNGVKEESPKTCVLSESLSNTLDMLIDMIEPDLEERDKELAEKRPAKKEKKGRKSS